MILRRKPDWQDSVRFIGLGHDEDKMILEAQVKARDWIAIEQYQTQNGYSTCSKDFGVISLPHRVLIDKTGTIVYTGSAVNRLIEEDIDKLLQDEELVGIGTKTCAKFELDERTEEVTNESCDEIHQRFEKEVKGLFDDSFIMCSSKRLNRAFVVLVFDVVFDL